jgi:tetratricopeptide (TPR) repeat protein
MTTRVVKSIAVALGVATALGMPSAAVADAPLGGPTAQLMAAYIAHPQRYRRQLLALGAGDPDGLPTPVLLALADARLRGGRFRPAAELCQRVLERPPQEPWTGWAAVGKAWADIGAGADATALDELAKLAEENGQSTLLAAFLLGLVDGANGNFERALVSFERVGSAAGHDGLRAAGRLGAGLARYWQGDYDAAGAAFDEITRAPTGPLTDDARYGSARSRLARGDRAGAIVALKELAELPRTGVRVGYTKALVNLDPKAYLRAAVERQRRSASGLPESQVAAALDSDGGALARAALRDLASVAEPAEAAAAVDDEAPVPAQADLPAAVRVAAPAPPRAEATPPLFAFAVLAAVLLFGVGFVVRSMLRRS